MTTKVAVVTGANRGLGLAIVKGLCQKYQGTVYLTARNEKLGKKAVKKLNELGLKPQLYLLDVSIKKSVEKFAHFLKKKHDGLDVLVNNAGILEWDKIYPDYEAAKRNIDVNYRSLLFMEEYMFPLMRAGARVVNIASAGGHLSNLKKEKWIKVMKSKDLTVKQVNDFVEEYLKSVKNGTFDKNDFADEGKHAEHRVSKIGVVAVTKIFQKKYPNISMNALHPGHMKTDMSHGGGETDPGESAKVVFYLIFEASPNLKGEFIWYDGKVVDWYDVKGDFFLQGLW